MTDPASIGYLLSALLREVSARLSVSGMTDYTAGAVHTDDPGDGQPEIPMYRAILIPLLLLTGMTARADLPAEPIGRVETLPVPYPQHWVLAHDVAFHHMMDGKMILLDPRADSIGAQMKGMFNAAFVAAFTQAATRPEMYVAETFYERINRGKRTDVVTVYDKATLAPVAEIVLPGEKRAGLMPGKYALRLTNDESLLLVYNFTPAMSITVVDPVQRKVLNEIALPACALIFPTGMRGFSSLCSNASMMTWQLDANGQVAARHAIDPFFDIDEDALMEKPAIIGGVGYFPTFLGNVQEIDLSGDRAKLGQRWNLVPGSDRAEGWRPGGIQVTGDDVNGRLYVLMHPEGAEGTHKDGGPEVWVYDVKKRARVQRIVLENWGLSVELTREAEPLLLVVNPDMNIDVYEAGSGRHVRTLSDFGQETPLILHAVR
jgi:methylamine dehydrogenase heavy chain